MQKCNKQRPKPLFFSSTHLVLVLAGVGAYLLLGVGLVVFPGVREDVVGALVSADLWAVGSGGIWGILDKAIGEGREGTDALTE